MVGKEGERLFTPIVAAAIELNSIDPIGRLPIIFSAEPHFFLPAKPNSNSDTSTTRETFKSTGFNFPMLLQTSRCEDACI
jgi:hypothetical protein